MGCQQVGAGAGGGGVSQVLTPHLDCVEVAQISAGWGAWGAEIRDSVAQPQLVGWGEEDAPRDVPGWEGRGLAKNKQLPVGEEGQGAEGWGGGEGGGHYHPFFCVGWVLMCESSHPLLGQSMWHTDW